ncbi:MAG: T9SS type A sorting domain-containing protein, partial [Bacteroidota bacterium]
DSNIKLIPLNELWETCQPEGSNVSFSTTGETQSLDLLAQATEACALLEVDISLGAMRRCFEDQVISIQYQNVGTLPVVDGLVGLHLPEELSYSGTNGNLIGTSGDTLVFAIHSLLALGEQGQFEVFVDVSCDAVLNSSLCVTALSLPYNPCPSPDENWSGGSIAVAGECTGEEVVFDIRNEGDNPLTLGNSYIIIQDGVMLFQVPETIPPLLPGGSTQINFTADGSTYRIEASQEPFHPGFSFPTAVVEGCGINENSGISTGFVTYFPNNDTDYYIDEDCQIVTGSYDPNDKQAEPKGYGEEHYILPEQQLEYTIRFQNTGNDTAFTVIIRDTLNDWLDMQTFRPGISSHTYEVSFDSARAVNFIFDDILLPDSTTNLAASQGFITYKVRPKTTAPLETRIENTAAIYFDFNEPIITNTTYHQLGEDFVEFVNTNHNLVSYDSWTIFPNPVQNTLTLIDERKQQAEVVIYDAFGREKIKATISNGYQILDVKVLVPGWYTLQIISEEGQLIRSTKLIKVE